VARKVDASSVVVWLALPAILFCGCSSKHGIRPRTLVSPLATLSKPAKGDGCAMRVLAGEPSNPYHQIAIVEGWGEVGQESEVLRAVRNKACETGADALLVVTGNSQFHREQVYGVTPNRLAEEVWGASANYEPGHYINEKEYKPQIGEFGHSGYYLDTVAIVFQHDAPADNHHEASH
jgi:hypothetical protein